MSTKLPSVWLLAALAVALTHPPAASAQAPRNFQMMLFDTFLLTPDGVDASPFGRYGDMEFFPLDFGLAQPPGRVVIKHSNWMTQTLTFAVGNQQLEWARIDAVYVDEPYLNAAAKVERETGTNPCVDPRAPSCRTLINSTRARMNEIGQEIKGFSPRTRFWVNLSEPELLWLGYQWTDPSPPNSLISDAMDVISLDKYNFNDCSFDTLGAMLAFLRSARTRSSQQIGLVPGTYTRSVVKSDGSLDTPTPYNDSCMAAVLQASLAYAESANQTCNQPLGPLAMTGRFDGCPVWVVAGYTGPDERLPSSQAPCSTDHRVGATCSHGIVSGRSSLTALQYAKWMSYFTRPNFLPVPSSPSVFCVRGARPACFPVL